MKPFEYTVPTTLAEATHLLAAAGARARVLAGGTDVLVELRKPSAVAPGMVVDIGRIQELRGIRVAGDEIMIGSLTTHTELLRSDILRDHAPFLWSAAATIGSPQIRNRGTIGGNIMNAAACADTVPPLVALGARLSLQSSAGERQVPISDFFVKPYVTVARSDEILTSIRFPRLPRNARSVFIKLGRRNAVAISRLSVAAVVVQNAGGKIGEARIVPGAVFPVWRRVTEAEQMLVGCSPVRELFVEAGRAVAEAMISFTGHRWSTEYKEPIIAVLVRRALEACCA